MKRFLKTAISIVLLMPAAVSGFASGTLYVYYDAACMDRLEYVNRLDPSGRKFIAYHVNTTSSDKIVLSVGSENPNPVAQLPAQTLHCGNTIFDQRFVGAVNQRVTEVLMVRASGDGRYHISKVAYAAFFSSSGGTLMYQSPKVQFAFSMGTGVIGENISLNKASSIVQFEGRMENNCSGEYIFSASDVAGSGPYAGMVVVPEIGIVEERSGANMDEAMRNVLRLETVNNRPVQDHLRLICRGERPVPVTSSNPANSVDLIRRTSDIPVSAEKDVPLIADSGMPAGTAIVLKNSGPCNEVSGNGYHIVQKGENLYRISQQYGVSVSQIRDWNGIPAANAIFPCQKLRVSSFAAPAPSGIPGGYSAESLTVKGIQQDQPAWKTWAGTHVVQPGETIASIAMKYGYSEYRFRYFNNLGAGEVAKVGQSLRTTDCDCPSVTTPVRSVSTPTPSSYGNVLTPRSPVFGGETTTSGSGLIRSTVAGSTDGFSTETELTSNSWKSAAGTPIPTGYDYNSTAGSTGQMLSGGLSNRMNTGYDYSVMPQNYESGTARRTIHLVGSNDTLSDIARRYDTTVENLRRLNNLNPGETIIPGQRLYVN